MAGRTIRMLAVVLAATMVAACGDSGSDTTAQKAPAGDGGEEADGTDRGSPNGPPPEVDEPDGRYEGSFLVGVGLSNQQMFWFEEPGADPIALDPEWIFAYWGSERGTSSLYGYGRYDRFDANGTTPTGSWGTTHLSEPSYCIGTAFTFGDPVVHMVNGCGELPVTFLDDDLGVVAERPSDFGSGQGCSPDFIDGSSTSVWCYSGSVVERFENGDQLRDGAPVQTVTLPAGATYQRSIGDHLLAVTDDSAIAYLIDATGETIATVENPFGSSSSRAWPSWCGEDAVAITFGDGPDQIVHLVDITTGVGVTYYDRSELAWCTENGTPVAFPDQDGPAPAALLRHVGDGGVEALWSDFVHVRGIDEPFLVRDGAAGTLVDADGSTRPTPSGCELAEDIDSGILLCSNADGSLTLFDAESGDRLGDISADLAASISDGLYLGSVISGTEYSSAELTAGSGGARGLLSLDSGEIFHRYPPS